MSTAMLAPSSKMVHTLLAIIVLLVVTSSSSPLSSSSSVVEGRWRRSREKVKEREEKEKLLGKMVDAAELGLGFFSSDYSSINVDGVFGMRLGQGQIIAALQECQSSGSCPAKLQRRLQALTDDIDVTAKAALSYVQAMDADYFRQFLKTISQPYTLRYDPVTLTDLDLTPAGSKSSYDEEKGDRCFTRMMGTFQGEDGRRVEECNITENCWAMMTQENRARYSKSHQLLYFILVEKEGCQKVVEKSMKANVTETETRTCGSIYNEALKEVKYGAVSEDDQDLFLEQVLLCGCLGYENFMRSDWMKMVLMWQRPSGCFSMDDPDLVSGMAVLSQAEDLERKLMKDLQQEAKMIRNQRLGRQLLREHVMNDGCLSHKSGLGFGNLCLFTRYLVRQVYLHQ